MNKNQIFTAIDYNNIELLKSLWRENREDFSIPNEIGLTPLIRATIWQRTEMVYFLVNEVKVSVSQRDTFGKTALSRAIDYSNISIIKILIDAGINTNGFYQDNESYIFHLIKTNKINIIKLIINESNLEINEIYYNYLTPLAFAVYCENIDIVKMLLESNALIETKNISFNQIFQMTSNNEIKKLLLTRRGYLRANAFYTLDKIFPSDVADYITWMI